MEKGTEKGDGKIGILGDKTSPVSRKNLSQTKKKGERKVGKNDIIRGRKKREEKKKLQVKNGYGKTISRNCDGEREPAGGKGKIWSKDKEKTEEKKPYKKNYHCRTKTMGGGGGGEGVRKISRNEVMRRKGVRIPKGGPGTSLPIAKN